MIEEYINTFHQFINESSYKDRKPGKEGMLASKSISKEMKDKILPFITSQSYYVNKKVMELNPGNVPGKSFDGVSLGADNNGFFCYTHRARSKSKQSFDKIPDKDIKFIKSTG